MPSSAKIVRVLDSTGRALSPTTLENALSLVAEGKAAWLDEPRTVLRLLHPVQPTPHSRACIPIEPLRRGNLLLHICCAPCATYCIEHLRGEGFDLTGYWYNPNIHPSAEHELRRSTLEGYAALVTLPMCWEAGYDPNAYHSSVEGHTGGGERCAHCYRLRLDMTARRAAQAGMHAFSTTLLISPYQDQAALRKAGEEAGRMWGVAFHFEDMRKGWSERGRMANLLGLYKQRYCGCSFSRDEAEAARAARVAKHGVSP
jgi:hypothetical protein